MAELQNAMADLGKKVILSEFQNIEVYILHGEPGARQKKIHPKIAPFP